VLGIKRANGGALLVDADARLIVQSAGQIVHTGPIQLSRGSTLQSINGLHLQSGGVLDSSGNASVVGRFQNDGFFAASATAGNWLSFNDAVSGTGNFSGNVRFNQGYSPGGNATAQVSFGQLGLLSSTSLTLDIAGNGELPGGTVFDQLNLSGTAWLDGSLNIAFAPGFAAAAGQSFVLMTWAGYSGAFDSVAVSGLAPAFYGALDYGNSELRLTMAVVPEPGSWAMPLADLASIGFLVRRRRQGLAVRG